MSIKHRVKKLERNSSNDFHVIVPTQHNWNGRKETLENRFDDDDVGAVSFGDLTVERHEDEEYWDFCNRARAEALAANPVGTFVLSVRAIFL